MERQQREMEETSDRHYELMNSNNGGTACHNYINNSGPMSFGGNESNISNNNNNIYHQNNNNNSGLPRLTSLNNTARTTPTLFTATTREVSTQI